MSRLAITKRYSLAGVGEGWQDCYLIYRPASYADLMELRTLKTDDMTEEDALAYQRTFTLDRVVSGKLLELDASNNPVLVDYLPEHLEQLPKPVVDDLFNCISGVSSDPKDLKPTTNS